MGEQTKPEFLFLGNQLWLDFLNTRIKQGDEWVDLLGGFADFIGWLESAQVLDSVHAQAALHQWSESAEQAVIMEEVRTFRKWLRSAAENMAQGAAVPEEAVTAINRVLQQHRRFLQLVWNGGTLVSRYAGEITEPIHLLAPVAESAVQALTGEDRRLTRKCENAACVLYFHDTTKNHTRRWCSMETCGNRRKAAAHYQRSRAS